MHGSKNIINLIIKSLMMKSQNPKKHHYVPESYLKKFCFDDSGFLFSLKVKSQYSPEPIKRINKSAICYQPNLYKISSQKALERLGIPDAYHLEKSLFDYENSTLEEIINDLDQRKNLTFSRSQELVRILLNLKQRNISMKKQMFQDQVFDPLIDKQIRRIEIYFKTKAISEGFPIEKVDEFILYLRKQIEMYKEDKNFRADLFSESLYRWSKRDYKQSQKIEADLVHSKFSVLFTEKENFIVSDNPGYNIHENDQFHNSNINGSIGFVFTLSPKTTIVISPNLRQSFTPIIKKINYVPVNKRLVEEMNLATAINCNERIFSKEKESLEEVKKHFTKN